MGNMQVTEKVVELVMYPDGRMDTENAAAYVGKSPKTMAMLRCAGTGPTFIKRGRIFYYKDDLDAWLRDGAATSTAQSRVRSSHVGGVCKVRAAKK